MSDAKRAKGGSTQYDALEKVTTIVADTGDFKQIKKYAPTDATTNPSLIFKASQIPEYSALVDEAVAYGKQHGGGDQGETLALILDKLSVAFGTEITKIIPGYVSTEVDARLSFDTEGSVSRARRIIKMYEANGVPKERVLIKLATTWEGIQAAKILKKEGVSCNMTLLFAFEQAVACAEADVRLISPFVGRILDWYKKDQGVAGFPIEEDPGVLSVRRIYNYYKKHGYDTIVMGASFRSKDQVTALAGCDRLTIGLKFLEELKTSTDDLPTKISAELAATQCKEEKRATPMDEKTFRLAMARNAMATEKLAHGIRGFANDIEKLEKILLEKMV
jgi:transaldolase|eukprot:g1882.t1